MSQKDFAKKLKISAQYLCDVEKGRRVVSAKMAAEFAKKLGRHTQKFIKLALQDELTSAGLRFEVEIKAA
jgi:transcriptional regulator with XRE-family HTH domain